MGNRLITDIRKGRLPDHPLVKVCGLTQRENALACARAGADIIGLVFFPKSPRNVEQDQARAITEILPVPACGVFVDASYDTIMARVEACGLNAVQLHGKESPALASRIAGQGILTIKAFFAAREPALSRVGDYPDIDFFLAEYGKGVLPGGNAETWDYGMVKTTPGLPPLMLAGGLSCENVSDAVAKALPGAVDASSSLESSPGIKDLAKVRAFIRSVKH